jgi:cytochrome c
MRKVWIAGSALVLIAGLAFRAQGADADKGKEVFDQCAACHNADSTDKKMGPGLKGLFQHEKLKNGKKPTDATVMDIVNKGGNGMPAYADLLSVEEKANLLAYLHTL